jgi:hypothetical protein
MCSAITPRNTTCAVTCTIGATGDQQQPGAGHHEEQGEQGLLQQGLEPPLSRAQVVGPGWQGRAGPPDDTEEAEEHD